MNVVIDMIIYGTLFISGDATSGTIKLPIAHPQAWTCNAHDAAGHSPAILTVAPGKLTIVGNPGEWSFHCTVEQKTAGGDGATAP